jgi:hypothetical protein
MTLLRDVLHHFGYTGTPAYRCHPYCQFERGRFRVHVDIPTHPSDPSMTAWFTTARAMTSMTPWIGLPTIPSWSSVSATCWASTVPPLPCSPFETRATQCGLSAWLPLATPSFRPTTRIERSRHATPSTCAPCFRRPPRLALTSTSTWRSTPTR